MYHSNCLQRRERLSTIAGMEESDWNDRLRRARRAAGMTQAAVGHAAGLSMQTVRAYERRRRHPTRPHLVAMLDALRVERGERNAMLASAGFAGDADAQRGGTSDGTFSTAEAADEVRHYRWPAFVTNEYATVLAANRATQGLWSTPFGRHRSDMAERNLLTVLSNSHLAKCLLNWDEALTRVISVVKGHAGGGEDLDHPSPQFKIVLDRIFAGDAAVVARFMQLWHKAPVPPAKLRWSYPIVWQQDDGALLRFDCFVSMANAADALTFHDWIPLDGMTWAAVEHAASGDT
jgi:transcriptional regulator with XRE-family HTH domain